MAQRLILLLGFIAPAVLAQGSLSSSERTSGESRRIWVKVEEIR